MHEISGTFQRSQCQFFPWPLYVFVVINLEQAVCITTLLIYITLLIYNHTPLHNAHQIHILPDDQSSPYNTLLSPLSGFEEFPSFLKQLICLWFFQNLHHIHIWHHIKEFLTFFGFSHSNIFSATIL